MPQTGQVQPGMRSGHTITTVGKNHILFGGLEGKSLGNGDKNNDRDQDNRKQFTKPTN